MTDRWLHRRGSLAGASRDFMGTKYLVVMGVLLLLLFAVTIGSVIAIFGRYAPPLPAMIAALMAQGLLVAVARLVRARFLRR